MWSTVAIRRLTRPVLSRRSGSGVSLVVGEGRDDRVDGSLVVEDLAHFAVVLQAAVGEALRAEERLPVGDDALRVEIIAGVERGGNSGGGERVDRRLVGGRAAESGLESDENLH